YSMSVCGPNCIGVASTHDSTVLTSTCSRQPARGSISLVSHSGALAFTTFFERGADEDVGFAHIVSTGNEVDLALADYVEYVAGDPNVDVVCAYIEGVENPGRFGGVASEAVRGGTPVLAVKVGKSEVAEKSTLSHTGSLTGNDEAWDAAFRQAGVERVPDIPDLLGRANAHSRFDPP
ncbi:MAG: CoA-binding protein, partial [Halobacteria archaeon]|nr:CoA-binding protein [Halobacteria archaeon]